MGSMLNAGGRIHEFSWPLAMSPLSASLLSIVVHELSSKPYRAPMLDASILLLHGMHYFLSGSGVLLNGLAIHVIHRRTPKYMRFVLREENVQFGTLFGEGKHKCPCRLMF